MDVIPPLVAETQTSELMQPGDGALHHPAHHTQAAAMRRIPTRQDRRDPFRAQLLAMRLGVVGPIPLDALGSTPRVAHLPTDGRDGVHEGHELGDVVPVGLGQPDGQGDAVPIRDEVMFAPQLPSIRRIRTRFFPPRRARMEEESTMARDQSSWSAARSWASNTRWSRVQTPARCQAWRRRQQVMPEPHPSSRGRYSHGMPVLSTNRIPVKTCRLSNGLRPGYRRRRRLGLGRSGAIWLHNRSSTRIFAMQDSSLWDDSRIGYHSDGHGVRVFLLEALSSPCKDLRYSSGLKLVLDVTKETR